MPKIPADLPFFEVKTFTNWLAEMKVRAGAGPGVGRSPTIGKLMGK
jgi:hypothetical protein